MITNEKIRLLEAWKDNLFEELTNSEIKEYFNKETKTWSFNSLKILNENNLLNLRKKGNQNFYSLNIHNPLTTQTLQYLEAQKNYKFPKLDIITETIEKIHLKNYCMLVFGSYAKGNYNKDSDLDICFLVENKNTEKKIKPYFNEVKLSHKENIDEHYITFEEFKEMLLRGEENLGKQIFRKNKIFFNPDIYYKLIKEAHKNGFRI